MNLVGALRRAMATTGYTDLKEFQRVEVVVSRLALTSGTTYSADPSSSCAGGTARAAVVTRDGVQWHLATLVAAWWGFVGVRR